MIAVKGSLVEADMLPVARYTVWNRSWAMKYIFYGGIAIVVAGISTWVLSGEFTPAPFVGLLLGFYPLITPRLSVKSAIKSAPYVSEEGIYEFEESKFTIGRPSLQVAMNWSSVHSVVELKDQFAIFATKYCFNAIPKRFFTPDQIVAFRQLLDQSLGKKFETRVKVT